MGAAGKGEDKPVDSLKFFNDKAAWKEAFTQVGAAGKKDTGIGLTPTGYSDSNAYSAFIRSSFRTKEKPDLFTWHTGKELEDLVDQGVVAETTEQWTKAVADGNIPEALKQYFTVEGKQYCVPLLAGYWVMYYNKAVFAKAGVTPPKTWADLIAVADKLKAAGVKPFYETNILFSFVWFETLLAGKNPDLYDALVAGQGEVHRPGCGRGDERLEEDDRRRLLHQPGLQDRAAGAAEEWRRGDGQLRHLVQRQPEHGEDEGRHRVRLLHHPERQPGAAQDLDDLRDRSGLLGGGRRTRLVGAEVDRVVGQPTGPDHLGERPRRPVVQPQGRGQGPGPGQAEQGRRR